MIYLDNAATTPIAPEVIKEINEQLSYNFGNPSSIYPYGKQAKRSVNQARNIISNVLQCKPNELYFTSGGSDSDNWAIEYGAKLMRQYGNHIITSAYEHPAVKKILERLSNEYQITELMPDDTGHITPQMVASAIRPETVLVSIMLVNNEIGTINDIAGISKILKSHNHKILLHTDAVQGFMKIPFTIKSLGADMISICSHKIHGPKGIGALYVNNKINLEGLIVGGAQEMGKRAGTENVPYICGFAKAVELASASLQDNYVKVTNLKKYLINQVQSLIPDIIFYPGDSPYIISMTKLGSDNESVVLRLGVNDICVSTASACKNGGKSQVLKALGKSEEYINGTIRISLSRYTTKEDIDALCDALKNIYT